MRRLSLTAVLAVAIAAALPVSASHTPWSSSPGVPPPGANDPACVSLYPPVILVHGTYGDMTVSWNLFSPALRAYGFCPWAFDLPERATADLQVGAQALRDFTLSVMQQTRAATVSMIGHSQGGMQIRHAIKDFGLPVDDAISLSGSHYGTTSPLAGLAYDCPACQQQIAGSAFYTTDLNVGDLTPGTAFYTQIQTRYDEIVTPPENAFLPTEALNVVTNVWLQDACPADATEHIGIIYDPIALDWVLNALVTPGPADPMHVPAPCQRPDPYPDPPY